MTGVDNAPGAISSSAGSFMPLSLAIWATDIHDFTVQETQTLIRRVRLVFAHELAMVSGSQAPALMCVRPSTFHFGRV